MTTSKRDGQTYHEVTRDFALRSEAVEAAKSYQGRDKGHSITRIRRKPNGKYVVVQSTKHA